MYRFAEPHRCTRIHIPRRRTDFYYQVTPARRQPHPNPHHVLVLQTATRRPSTLADTLESLFQAGLREWPGPKLISADQPLTQVDWGRSLWSSRQIHDLVVCRESVHEHGAPPVGAARAFVSALRLSLAIDPDLELLTFVEDDVELCRNTLTYANQIVVPESATFITWFTYDYDWSNPPHDPPRVHPSRHAETCYPVLAIRPSRFFILTQMITLPRATIELILQCPRAARDWPKLDGHDELIAWALGDAPYATHFPVLVQHTGGLNSAVVLARGGDPGPQEGARTSPYYVGRDFDALSLVK
jgi:hypothetical protein